MFQYARHITEAPPELQITGTKSNNDESTNLWYSTTNGNHRERGTYRSYFIVLYIEYIHNNHSYQIFIVFIAEGEYPQKRR